MKVKRNYCVIIILILLLSLSIFYFSQLSFKEKITGLATYQPGFQETVSVNDVLFWQGQYYTGTTFNTGTYEFNFTVYDAKEGGNICYSNTTILTTGNWGEWKTEQHGVNAACNNASKNYFLNINIEGVDQLPRRRLVIFNYLRKDTDETHSHNLNILGNASFGTNIRLEGEKNIIRFNNDIYLDGKGSFEIKNTDPYDKVVINKSDINLYTKSNNTSEIGFYANNLNKYKLRYNDSSETFSIHETNLNKDVIIIKDNDMNFSGNIYGNGNVTLNYGFFSYLGSLVNRITKLWVHDIDANHDVVIGRNLEVGRDLKVERNLQIDGNLELTGNLEINGNIESSGNIEVGGCIEYNGGTLGTCI